jgi:peptidoglycan/xylan/chitin deacetylase (PgdA/CDA1 family)
MSRKLVFTVDLDRDVNLPLKGEVAAGSMDRGEGSSPRFLSSEEGLRILLELLDEIGVRSTFFVEGRTAETIDCASMSGHCIGLHGFDHEDLTGESTEVPVDVHNVLSRGFDAVSDNIARPVCFRAPYMRCDDSVLGVVKDLGIRHDSSVYRYPEEGQEPYMTQMGVMEHPVPKSRDQNGKVIAAYLWPMHEGKRIPEDYIRMASESTSSEFVLATHTWHMVETIGGGPMDDDEVCRNLAHVRDVLTGIMDSGYRSDVMCPSLSE